MTATRPDRGEHGVVTVGVADTEHSGPALDWASAEAVRRGARLDVVHAVHHALLERSPQEYRAAVAAAAATVLREAHERVSAAAPDQPVRCHTVHGPASGALLDAARRSDLLVVGTRGRGGADGLSLGSTASWVAARACRPVVLVRAAPAPVDPGRGPVVVAVDGSPEATAAARFAADRATATGSALVLVHVWDALDTYPGLAGSVPESTGTWFRQVHGRVLAGSVAELSLSHPGLVPQTRLVASASVAAALLEAADTAAVLVLGTRGRGASSGAVLGPVTRAVLHRSRVPVAVVGRPSGVVDDHVRPLELGEEF